MKIRTIALVLAPLALSLVNPARGDAAILTVCASGCGYTTIAAAIGAASAGDTISVLDTVHKEAHITVNKNLTIQGKGASKTAVDGNLRGPIFTIDDGVTATIQDLTIRNADSFDSFLFYGAGIYNKGTTTLRNAAVSDNTALSAGGGIYNTGTIGIINSIISDNVCNGGNGGGIYSKGTVTIDNSTVSGNFADFVGGGIYNDNEGTLTVTRSTLSNNTAFGVGGLFNNGTITITNSTISGNSSGVGGSGIGDEGTSTISNSTIAGNTIRRSGAALLHSLYSSMTIKNSIIGDNTGGNGNCLFTESPSSVTALGANLDTDGSCGSVNFTRVTPGQLKLGPLALNAPGTTETQALLPGSVAIDAATDCTDAAGIPLTIDDRGAPRPDFGELACDIGAYESQETFAGKPGAPNCHGKSVSALAKQYKGLGRAASALKFPSVKALQAAIRAYCRD